MQLEIYTRKTCSRCDYVKGVLNTKNIPYAEHVIDEVEVTREEVLSKFPEAKILPIVVLDNTWIGGRDELMRMINLGKLDAVN